MEDSDAFARQQRIDRERRAYREEVIAGMEDPRNWYGLKDGTGERIWVCRLHGMTGRLADVCIGCVARGEKTVLKQEATVAKDLLIF